MNTVKDLVAQNQMAEALALLAERLDGPELNEVIALQSRWQALSWQRQQGTIHSETAGVEHNRIRTAILDLDAPQYPKKTGTVALAVGEVKTYFNRWPTLSSLFVGRTKERELLDEAWENDHTHIVSFVAMGGTGKTALVNTWLNQLQADGYRGARRVFGWSFYSQGAGEDKQSSAELFIEEALRWCGVSTYPQDAWSRGRVLAEAFSQQATLLLLDGVEPLQLPISNDQDLSGKLKDPGLESLLTHLARGGPGPGLCVISTRIALPMLHRFGAKSAFQQSLEQLDPASGSALLQLTGVEGSEAELQAASQDFQGHALALTLLGRYLSRHYQGDIRHRDKIPPLEKGNKIGRAARRMMASYEKWLQAKPELDFLLLLGLFDRPMSPGALQALLAKPPIPGLTKRLTQLDPEASLDLLENLRDLRLLSPPETENQPRLGEAWNLDVALDTHPLVREHFAEVLEKQRAEAWQEAHLRLYHYYRALPEKHQPDTLQEMEPLFAAIGHGVKAGKVQEAYDEIYLGRINREGKYYLTSQLGAFVSSLSVLSNFFIQLWSQPHPKLSRLDQLVCLGNVGFDLLALGRSQEALGALEAVQKEMVNAENWIQAAISANNLSALQLSIGQVEAAVRTARRGMEYADRSEANPEKQDNRATFAEALAAAGKNEAVGKLFQEAEVLQQKVDPTRPRLYSLRGYQYAIWLLEQGKLAEAADRAGYALEISRSQGWLLDISLDTLTLGRVALLEKNLPAARDYLNETVVGLRRAGAVHHLPEGLLTRATCARTQQDWSQALTDLQEVYELIERTGFRLYLVDYHLEMAHCCLAGGEGFERAAAKEHVAEAARLIEEMGYHRRDGVLQELRGKL